MNSGTIATCREALEYQKQSYTYGEYRNNDEVARIDAALLDLEQPSEWTPLQTKIAFGFGHESIVIDATSIGGLPLPADVMIMQRTPAQPAAGGPLPEDVLETITSALSEWYIYNHERKPLVDKALAWLQRQRGERGDK